MVVNDDKVNVFVPKAFWLCEDHMVTHPDFWVIKVDKEHCEKCTGKRSI